MIRSVPAHVAGSRIAAAWAASRAQVPFAPAVGVRSAATYAKILDKVLGVDVHNKEKVVARHELDSIYDKPVSLPATHGIPVCRVALWSFQLQRIDFYVDFCRKAAYHMGVSCSGAVPMPTVIRRWTVLRSPFVHKSSMEVFERRTRKRVMFVRDTDPAVVE
ncbi:mitochondrial 37S ribosomal protein rsm10, partial [Coemansia spiralis]